MAIPIFTSSWRTAIDDTKYARVAISRGVPRGRQPGTSGYRRFAKLTPGPWFQSISDPVAWAARYREETLASLDPAQTVAELRALASDGQAIVLLCWETYAPWGGFCHRGLVAAWLKDSLDLDVCELGDTSCACGHRHPMLPPELRRE